MAAAFEDIWDLRVDAALATDAWTGGYAYNAAQYFEAPLSHAYGPDGSDAKQAAFRAYFEAFEQTGYEDGVSWLSRGQHGLLISAFIRAEEAIAGGPTALTEALGAHLLKQVRFEWRDTTVLDWDADSAVGRAASIARKLATTDFPITDGDLHLLALMSDLAAILAARGASVPAYLTDAVAVAEEVLATYGVFDDAGRWNFGGGAWTWHVSSQEADWSGTGPVPVGALPEELGWDTSHMARFPLWLDSFERGLTATGRDAVQIAAARDGLTRQMLDLVLTPDPGGSGAWLTTNYMDGSNGIYRLGFQSFPAGQFYDPFGLSGTYLLGQWAGLDDARITATFADLLGLGPFDPALLEVFNEPVRRVDEGDAFNWRDLIESGDIRLWLALAAEEVALDPLLRAPEITDHVSLAVSEQIAGTALWAELLDAPGLTAATRVEVIDIDPARTVGGLYLDGTRLAADQVHALDLSDLADLAYRADGTGLGDRVYWRLDADPGWTPWSSLDIVRDNTPGSLTFDTIAGDPGTRRRIAEQITYTDPDGDAALYYQLWHDASGPLAGFSQAGIGLEAGTNVTVTSAQLAQIDLTLLEGVGYWIRANDGGDWTDWDRIPIFRGNAAPELDLVDVTHFGGRWMHLDPRHYAFDGNGDSLVSVELWDDTGARNWWADGGIVDASQGHVTGQLADIWLQAAPEEAAQTLWMRGFDGEAWGDWDSFVFAPRENTAPILVVADQSLRHAEWLRLSDVLFLQDPDGDRLEEIEVWDDTAGPNWWADGEMVTAATGYVTDDPDGVWIRGDQVSSTQGLWARGFDGQDWGPWEMLTLTTTANSPPVINIADQTVVSEGWIHLADVLGYADAESDDLTRIEVWDDAGVANWWADGGMVDASVGYRTDTASGVWIKGDPDATTQTLWVRAFDGADWGPWQDFRLTTTSNFRPVVEISDQTLDIGQSRALSDVLNYRDDDGDTLKRVQLWDDEGADSWIVDGAVIGAQSGFIAPDVADIAFANTGSGTLWVRAHDGQQWGQWDAFDIL